MSTAFASPAQQRHAPASPAPTAIRPASHPPRLPPGFTVNARSHSREAIRSPTISPAATQRNVKAGRCSKAPFRFAFASRRDGGTRKSTDGTL
jgi:hypothetical protein